MCGSQSFPSSVPGVLSSTEATHFRACCFGQETALPAVQRFAGYMAEVGIELSEAGVKSLAANVEMELINVAVKRAAMEQK
eukprot:SAG31_NODE_38_length_31498_cov_41.930539_5_plen_81_part_00